MDFATPLTELIKQGTGYVLFVLACLVIWRQQAQVDKKTTELVESYERRLADSLAMMKSYEASITKFTESQKEISTLATQTAAAAMTISENVRLLVYRKEGQ